MRLANLVVSMTVALITAGCLGPMSPGANDQEMTVSGTLVRAQTAEGRPGNYYLGNLMGMNYQLVNVPTSAQSQVGKQVAVTGIMDSGASGGGTMRIKVKKIEVLEGTPATQGVRGAGA